MLCGSEPGYLIQEIGFWCIPSTRFQSFWTVGASVGFISAHSGMFNSTVYTIGRVNYFFMNASAA